MKNIYRYLYRILRHDFMKLLKKRLVNSMGYYFQELSHKIKYYTNIFSQRFSGAYFFSNYVARRFILRFSPLEVFRALLRRQKRVFAGCFAGCFGRYTRRQRTHRYKFKFGRVTLNSFIMPIDFHQRFCRLKYGICNSKLWVLLLLRTINSGIYKFDVDYLV